MNKTKRASEIAVDFTPKETLNNKNENAEHAHVENLINQLFAEIRALKPAWRQAWANQDQHDKSKNHWVNAFIDAGLKDWARVELGLKSLRKDASDFVPAVGRFIEMCKPGAEELGAPNKEDAFRQAAMLCGSPKNYHKMHPITYDAMKATTAFKLKNWKEEDVKKLFFASYDEAIEKAVSGVELKKAPMLLERDLGEPVSQDQRQANLKRLRAMLDG